jgi:plastocyanin
MVNRRILVALSASLLVAIVACEDITAADGARVNVILTPKVGSAACVIADPEPAAVKVDQGISFVNNSTVHLTIVLVENNLPLVSVAPGDTSGAVKFNDPGIHQYYSQGCGSGTSELHTLSVTVN